MTARWAKTGASAARARTHANCIENLPVFGTVVFALSESGVRGPLVDGLCISVPVSRVLQSLVHVSFVQTSPVIAVRFRLFRVQAGRFLWLAVLMLRAAGWISEI